MSTQALDETLSVHEAIFTTRSMRHLKPVPVAKEDLAYLIEAATMAPSAGNLQTWSFVVVTNRRKIRSVALTYQEAGHQYIRDGVLADPDLGQDDPRRRVYTHAMHNVDHLDEAPALIIPCLTMPCPDNASIASGFFGSIYPAIQNILLAARARGLGTTLLTLGTDFSPVPDAKHPQLREILRLPDNVQSHAIIPVGYPKGQWGRPLRKDWRSCTYWDEWTA